MNLIKAVKSGKPFRRRGETNWWKECLLIPGEYISVYGTRDEGHTLLSPTVPNILAEDYETLDEAVTITLAHLQKALLYATSYHIVDESALWDALCQLGQLQSEEND